MNLHKMPCGCGYDGYGLKAYACSEGLRLERAQRKAFLAYQRAQEADWGPDDKEELDGEADDDKPDVPMSPEHEAAFETWKAAYRAAQEHIGGERP